MDVSMKEGSMAHSHSFAPQALSTERTDTDWAVVNGPHVIGSISQVQGIPSR
jgi:hypothetical protein